MWIYLLAINAIFEYKRRFILDHGYVTKESYAALDGEI